MLSVRGDGQAERTALISGTGEGSGGRRITKRGDTEHSKEEEAKSYRVTRLHGVSLPFATSLTASENN
jgi:hypothetical protein